MEKNNPWYSRQILTPECITASIESPTVEIPSVLFKKLLKNNEIVMTPIEKEPSFEVKSCPGVPQDILSKNKAQSLQVVEFVSGNKSSPVKIVQRNPKLEIHNSKHQTWPNSPADLDHQYGSFGKSTAYRVVQYLNMSGDSNDKGDLSNPIEYCSSAEPNSYAPSVEQQYHANYIKKRYEPGRYSSPKRDASDNLGHVKFWNHFCDVNTASPDIPSPIVRSSSYNDQVTYPQDVRSSQTFSTKVSSVGTPSLIPFPTTLPNHFSSPDNSWPSDHSLEAYNNSYDTKTLSEHVDFRKLDDYITENMERNLSPPRYFSQKGAGSFNNDDHNIEIENRIQPKTDIVALMQELAVTYGKRDSEEPHEASNINAQNDLMMNRGVDFCVFCKKNNQHATFYKSHTIKDKRGLCQCPVLRVYVCPLCKCTGDYAHTLKYCPYNSVTQGDPITAGLPPGKVTNWRNMAAELFSKK